MTTTTQKDPPHPSTAAAMTCPFCGHPYDLISYIEDDGDDDA